MERSSDKRAWQAFSFGGASAEILAAGGIGTPIASALHLYGQAANPAIIITCALGSTLGAVIIAVVKTRSKRPAETVLAEGQVKIANKMADRGEALKLLNQSAAIEHRFPAPGAAPDLYPPHPGGRANEQGSDVPISEEQFRQMMDAPAREHPAQTSRVSPG